MLLFPCGNPERRILSQEYATLNGEALHGKLLTMMRLAKTERLQTEVAFLAEDSRRALDRKSELILVRASHLCSLSTQSSTAAGETAAHGLHVFRKALEKELKMAEVERDRAATSHRDVLKRLLVLQTERLAKMQEAFMTELQVCILCASLLSCTISLSCCRT